MECIKDFLQNNYQVKLRKFAQGLSERHEDTIESYKKLFIIHYNYVKYENEKCNSCSMLNRCKQVRNTVNNIAEKDIILDGYGYCTYDSIFRAKDKLKINKAIISTNRYHLPRAIYIARRIGVEAYGIASDLRQYDRMKKYRKRERLAQIKDFFLVNFSLEKRKE